MLVMLELNHKPENSACFNCRLKNLCLPIALEASNIKYLEEIIERYTYTKGDYLYSQNNNFRSVYAVRSGSFKSSLINYDGETRINRFFFPGEIIGLDGIANRVHTNTVQALEHASVCEISFPQLQELSRKMPSLQNHFFSLMGKEITEGQEIHGFLSHNTAKERAVHFLLSLSARLARVSLSSSKLLLPMTRADIGEYLGLTLETVSRTLTQLQNKGLISVNNREVTLLQMDSLREIIGCSED